MVKKPKINQYDRNIHSAAKSRTVLPLKFAPGLPSTQSKSSCAAARNSEIKVLAGRTYPECEYSVIHKSLIVRDSLLNDVSYFQLIMSLQDYVQA